MRPVACPHDYAQSHTAQWPFSANQSALQSRQAQIERANASHVKLPLQDVSPSVFLSQGGVSASRRQSCVSGGEPLRVPARVRSLNLDEG